MMTCDFLSLVQVYFVAHRSIERNGIRRDLKNKRANKNYLILIRAQIFLIYYLQTQCKHASLRLSGAYCLGAYLNTTGIKRK